ncbi:MAG: branched-chain amino acid transaminase [Acidimicrobiia bacterium]|nr:branched-chain amino acid transaminase [Acidimicrobiia bacterium]MYF26335.1 branched-chain amino acid transaminase [Acidimicrobiia bacterium]MYH54848.1 branched-chain amino acid transaminase [Acidimicrobiia bacterium]
MAPMDVAKYVWLDGELVAWEDATVHVLTHALHYGTGVFEGIRAYEAVGGTAGFRLTDHMKRLAKSAKSYHMEIPYTVTEMVDAAKQVVRANEFSSAYIRPIAFLGLGALGLDPRNAQIQMAIITWQWGAYLGEEGLAKGIRVKTSSWRRFSQDAFPNAKATGTYINSILAKREAVTDGYDEALMLNSGGNLAEGSGENLFLVRDEVIYTPPLSAGCLEGITRDSIMTLLSDDGYRVEERVISRSDLYCSDELFMTGTAAEVTPVREVDNRPVGSGRVGPVTRRAQEIYADANTGKLDDYTHWLDYI